MVSDIKDPFTEIDEKARLSVVFITVSCITRRNGNPESWQASGFIISPDGYILTCSHVVPKEEEFTDIRLSCRIASRHTQPYPLELIDRNPYTDLALLKLPFIPGRIWTALENGDPTSLKNNEFLVLGFPFELDLMASRGVLGNRSGKTWDVSIAVNRGQSGGPVLDISGKVIAVVASGRPDLQHVNQVIPINHAYGFMDIAGARRARTRSFSIKDSLTHEPPASSPVEEAVQSIGKNALKHRTITFFVGPWDSINDPNLPPAACEIARELLKTLDFLEEGNDKVLLPPIDIIGLYYAIKKNERELQDAISGMLSERFAEIPETALRLAALMDIIRNRIPKSRISSSYKQLIITNNLDMTIERAFLRRGLNFTRLVHQKSGARIDINEYRDITLMESGKRVQAPGMVETFSLDDAVELGAFLSRCNHHFVEGNSLQSLALHPFSEPIVYKFHGSIDFPNSCAISAEQYSRFAREILLSSTVPGQITEIIGNTDFLFLGSRVLDAGFRLTYHTLLRKRFEENPMDRYALVPPPDHGMNDPYRSVDAKVWSRLKAMTLNDMKLTTLEVRGNEFLDRLIQYIEEQITNHEREQR